MAYKDAAVPEHAIRNDPVKSHMAVDVIRCRRAALYYAPDIPIFTPMDDIEPIVLGELPDLIYVSKPAPKNLDELLALLPFHGAGWYCKPSIEYCLHIRKLAWSDLQWGIRATSHFPSDQLRAALDVMEAAWDGIAVGDDKPWKRSINSWVGTCGMGGQSVNIKSDFSFCESDQPFGDHTVRSSFGGHGHGIYGVRGLYEYLTHTVVGIQGRTNRSTIYAFRSSTFDSLRHGRQSQRF
jgi:hypothetical protein